MKVNFGNFEVSGVRINFAYEGKNIWINVGNIAELVADVPGKAASGELLVADAQTRYPELTGEKAVKLPYITQYGVASTEYQWYYRIDLDLRVFGLQDQKIIMIETEIHHPLLSGLKDELL